MSENKTSPPNIVNNFWMGTFVLGGCRLNSWVYSWVVQTLKRTNRSHSKATYNFWWTLALYTTMELYSNSAKKKRTEEIIVIFISYSAKIFYCILSYEKKDWGKLLQNNCSFDICMVSLLYEYWCDTPVLICPCRPCYRDGTDSLDYQSFVYHGQTGVFSVHHFV